jgi:O-antigen ligase
MGVTSRNGGQIKQSKTIETILLISIALTSLAVLPWLKLDSTNLPKFLVVTCTGTLSLVLIILNFRRILTSNFKNIISIYLIFVVISSIVVFVGGTEKSTQLFGRFGRNTGYIAYVSLFSILVISVIISNKELIKKFFYLAFSIGSISLLIGYLQFFEISPVVNISDFGKIVGFFSNINFHSAFIGIVLSILLPSILNKSEIFLIRFSTTIILILGVGQIYLSKSIQGLLIFLLSTSLTLGYLLRYSKFIRFFVPYIIVNLTLFFLGLMSLFNKGPLAGLIYEASIKARGDYWAAGWKMTTLHPWFGVGFDGYGDWYRRTRTAESIIEFGPRDYSNAAHNVFLDISSSGGFPLLAIYLVLVLYTLSSAIKVLRRSREFNAPFASILAGWVAYQVQSLISINQLGLAIWGWVLSGLIIGYEINTRDNQDNSDQLGVVKGLKSKALIGFIIGFIIAFPPINNLTKIESAATAGDISQILKISKNYPLNIGIIENTLVSLYQGGKFVPCLELAKYATVEYKDSYISWKILSLLPNIDISELGKIRMELYRLDPLTEKYHS